MATKKSTDRVPRYKTKEGEYLRVGDDEDNYYLVWITTLDNDYGPEEGMYLGEGSEFDTMSKPADRDMRESWIAHHAARNLSDSRARNGRFLFNTRAKAMLALKEANRALHADEKPWPHWAVEAKANGWMPPKGWKP